MRLLLAEDERELSGALCAVLRRSNYTVDAGYDGEDALEYRRTGVYAAAVLDIMMPKMDGVAVLRAARAEGIAVPVLFLTAKSEIDDRVAGLDAGANDYLTKPFAMKELLARIRVLTRAKDQTGGNQLTFGNIALDRLTYELKCGEKAVRLANKEYQLLEMLLQNPGQVISAETMMDKIWGWDSDSELNVVRVYVSYVRKKLASVGADVKITAVRNVGYTVEKIV